MSRFNFVLGLNFIFLYFWVWKYMTVSLKQRKLKFEPRIKFNHNMVILAMVFLPLKSLSHLSSSNMNFVYPLSFSNSTNKLNLQACRRQLLIAMHIFNDHSQMKLAVLFSPAFSTPSAASAFKKTHRISQPRVGRKQGDEGFQARVEEPTRLLGLLLSD